MATGWSELPTDILTLIIGRLSDYIDLLRLAEVCRNWQSIATTKHRLHNLPLLVLKRRNDTCHSYYDLFTKKIHPLNLAESHGECIGSSQEWLITISKNKQIDLENPFSGVVMPLVIDPRIPEDEICGREMYYLPPGDPLMVYPYKVVLSSSPSIKGGECIAMAILRKRWILAMARPGDLHWTIVHCKADEYNVNEWGRYTKEGRYFQEIFYHDRKFYAVDSWGTVFVCDVGLEPKVTKVFDIPRSAVHYYLVGSEEGKMFAVVRNRCNRFHPENKFKVFEVQGSDEDVELVEAESLGRRAFFLGHNKSICISKLPQGFEGNCIYFNSDYCFEDADVGIFNYEERRLYNHYYDPEWNFLCHATWLTPRV